MDLVETFKQEVPADCDPESEEEEDPQLPLLLGGGNDERQKHAYKPGIQYGGRYREIHGSRGIGGMIPVSIANRR